jgi:hypothetical protein
VTAEDERCTWTQCPDGYDYEERDRAGAVWAKLCEKHHFELDRAIDSGDAKRIIGTWTRAHGTAAAFAARFKPEMEKLGRLLTMPRRCS